MVQNDSRKVVLKLKMPWRDATTRLLI